MIAGLLGVLAAGSSADVPAPTAAVVLACPSAQSDAHRPLLVQADEKVEAGDDVGAARTFVSAFDAMDLGNQVGGTGKFSADRAVTSYLQAYRIGSDVKMLEEADAFLVRYIEVLDRGIDQGCTVDRAWATGKLDEIRGMMPKEEETPVEDPEVKPPAGNCPTAPTIMGTDRVGVALVTIGSSLFAGGIGLLVTGVALPNLKTPQAYTISGGGVMAVGAALIVPGAIRLATWRRRRMANVNFTPWTGRGLAGLSVSGRFGARR